MRRLATDGDPSEQHYWGAFLADHFSSYEAFWLDNVVPLTGRDADRPDVHFRSREELAGRDKEVTVAQLHYTTLLHLGRVYDLLHRPLTRSFPVRGRIVGGPGSATVVAARAL